MVPASVSRCVHALAIAVAPRMRGVGKRERTPCAGGIIGKMKNFVSLVMKTALASGMKNSLALVVKNGLSPMMKNALRA